MSVIGWIVLGLIAGLIARNTVNGSGEGTITDVVLGIIGALVGGWLFKLVGHAGTTGLDLYSMFVAMITSIAVLFAYHGIRRI